MATRKGATKKDPVPFGGLIVRMSVIQPDSPPGDKWPWVLIPADTDLLDSQLRPIRLRRGVALQVPPENVKYELTDIEEE